MPALPNALLRRLPGVLLAAAAMAAALLVAPAYAAAVTVSAKADVCEKAQVTVALTPTDAPGLALLLVDGTVVRTAPTVTATPTLFADIALASGSHRVSAIVRSRRGLAFSAPVVVRSWWAPCPPAVSGTHAGIYQITQPLTLTVGSDTTRLTAILNGKTQWTKAVAAGQKVPVTFTLPPGPNTLELKAENPVGAATTKTVTLQRAQWPVPGHTGVGSEFGPRDGRMHKGIDIHAPYGSAVVAVAPGRVLWAENLTSYGGLVMIDHGGHIVTYYAHLSRIDVKLGQTVTAGQRIGQVGAAGTSHLHFQVFTGALDWNDTSDKFRRVNSGTCTDPRLWVGHP